LRSEIGLDAPGGADLGIVAEDVESVAWAEQYLPSSTTAIIVTSVPFWFILLDRKKWSYYFSNKILIYFLIII
jgi:hypothetical protein